MAFSICGAIGPAQWKRSLPALIPSTHDRRRVGPAARRQSLRRWTFGRQDCKTSCRLGEVSCSRLVSSAGRPFSLPPVQKCQASSCHVFVNLRSTRSVMWWVCSPGNFDPPVPLRRRVHAKRIRVPNRVSRSLYQPREAVGRAALRSSARSRCPVHSQTMRRRSLASCSCQSLVRP